MEFSLTDLALEKSIPKTIIFIKATYKYIYFVQMRFGQFIENFFYLLNFETSGKSFCKSYFIETCITELMRAFCMEIFFTDQSLGEATSKIIILIQQTYKYNYSVDFKIPRRHRSGKAS